MQTIPFFHFCGIAYIQEMTIQSIFILKFLHSKKATITL